MSGRHILALLAVVALSGCASSGPGFFGRALSTRPATPIETVESIPTGGLTTSGPTALDESTPCASVPAEVVAPAGFTDPPVANRPPGCVWLSAENLVLTVSSNMMQPFAQHVTEHEHMIQDDGLLSHLNWLRIDGHYAIERSLSSDSAATCFLILDVHAPRPVEIRIYRIDPATGEAVDMTPPKATEAFCPPARHVALNLLRELNPQ